jgi:small subunit ribosomal protein S1
MSELKKDQTDNEDQMSSQDYESLIDKYQYNATELSPGNLVKGTVIRITSTHVLVDVGFKSEGVIPKEDFDDVSELKAGDEVEAILEKGDQKEGYLILSRRKALAMKALNNLEKAYHSRSWIIGKVEEKIKNGYIVNVGIKSFMPDSHADIKPIRNPDSLIGNLYKFKIIKFDRKQENAVLSRKLFLNDEREKKKRRVYEQIQKNMKVKGKVKSLTNFGAFVDIGGVEGLLHISDISWGKINHPSELFEEGQEVEVLILNFNEKEDKISLGYKQMSADPWENIDLKYMAGQKVIGKVVSLTDFGAFVELEPGVEGLVHVSDLTWSRKMVHPKKILSGGQEVTVTVLNVNPSTKRISLGLKQATPHPLEIIQETFSIGSHVKGKITSITDFGAFLEVEKGVEGLIHISDISWKKIKHPSNVLTVGEETEAVILNIDVDKQKLSLGIKQLQGDIWEDFFKRHKMGDLVNVKVIRLADFGVFVEILPGIEGVVFVSELDDRKIENPAELFSVGDERLAKIIRLNPREKKISLSFRQAQYEKERLEYQKYARSQDGTATLGDIMSDQLKNISPAKPASEKPVKKAKAKAEPEKVEAKKEKKEEPAADAKKEKAAVELAAEKTVEKAAEAKPKKKTVKKAAAKKEEPSGDSKKQKADAVKPDKSAPKKEAAPATKKKKTAEKDTEAEEGTKTAKPVKKSNIKEENND